MKVLLLGGYGVFGERLARLLVRDGHAVTIAGRDLGAAERLATEIGAGGLRMDRAGALDGLAGFEVVIDAAGPFHAYGGDPYRLPRAAIAAGAHYLDLCDDADFCTGITALDGAARAAGVCVISGLSSVPALSSAAVTALAGEERPRVIDTAILPGNRSPRGRSVMRSILSQAGRPMAVWRGGTWEEVPGWSSPARYTLPGGTRRQGWMIEVPDLRLFPAHFGAGTVVFRAGLELAVMRYGLAAFAMLRRVMPVPISGPVLAVFKGLADLLAPFGSGRGAMSVTVITGRERRRWRLLAEDGDGPFIPAIAARALLRRDALPAGARPALGVVNLSEAEAAMRDLQVRTERDTVPFMPIFEAVLGESFAALPAPIRQTHVTADKSRWQGRSEVMRGAGLWPRLLAALVRFPPASPDLEVEVTKTVTRRGETWERRFGTRRFRSHLTPTRAGMTERFGPFTFLLGLRVAGEELLYPVRSGRVGPIPMPRWLLPVSEAREHVQDGRFHFDVSLRAPITGALIVRYRGWLVAATPGDPAAPPVRC
ncbi:SDR family oxidoreductase [Alterinioella nitratireducens]|uniref:SDR family oxidoreductase n=1 Tax=Alterinioella nitratireducens TaxID=2735915 RepID=UPI00155353B3|nr:SDR family oxidoreductase [Alterinioella nitratireducens]NPD20444.1 DUF4166 domain-containing protein [Alterinioella nitratireducens]